jgi:hypothetical protein
MGGSCGHRPPRRLGAPRLGIDIFQRQLVVSALSADSTLACPIVDRTIEAAWIAAVSDAFGIGGTVMIRIAGFCGCRNPANQAPFSGLTSV